MSNLTGDGIADVKSAACDILLEYRMVKNKSAKQDVTGLDKIYVAQPSQIRNNRVRTPNIPESLIVERERERQENLEQMNNLTEEERRELEEKRLKEDDIHMLERKIRNNRVKDLLESNGGEGVFFIPDRGNFFLFIFLFRTLPTC